MIQFQIGYSFSNVKPIHSLSAFFFKTQTTSGHFIHDQSVNERMHSGVSHLLDLKFVVFVRRSVGQFVDAFLSGLGRLVFLEVDFGPVLFVITTQNAQSLFSWI